MVSDRETMTNLASRQSKSENASLLFATFYRFQPERAMSYSVFSGAHISRPRQNLGGIVQNDSQSELIQRAKAEREARELQRQRERAVGRIQVSLASIRIVEREYGN